MNIGIIGTGSIARAHAMGIDHMNPARIRLHGCFDKQADAMQKFVTEYPCRMYASLDALLADPDIEAVVICLPHGFHSEVGIRCLESGKHVLVEKPMAPTVAECDALIQASKRSGKCLYVGHEYHLFEPIQKARDVLNSGELGRPLMVVSAVQTYIYGKIGTWWMDPKIARGGPGINMGVHQIDAISYLLGTMPRAVRGHARQLHPQAVSGIEDYFQIELDFDGVFADCRLYSFLKNLSQVVESGILVMCEQGYLRVWSNSLIVHPTDKDPETRIKMDGSKGYLAFIKQFEAFLDYVEDGKLPRATGEYGKAMVKCIASTISGYGSNDWVVL